MNAPARLEHTNIRVLPQYWGWRRGVIRVGGRVVCERPGKVRAHEYQGITAVLGVEEGGD